MERKGLKVEVKENRPLVIDVLDTKIMKKYKRTLKEKYSEQGRDIRFRDIRELVPTASGIDSFRRILVIEDADTSEVLKEEIIG